MSTDEHDWAHRSTAVGLTAGVIADAPNLTNFAGVDLGAALEQAIFTTMRGRSTVPDAHVHAARFALRVARHSALHRQGMRYGTGRVACLLGVGVHATLFNRVDEELQRRGLPPSIIAALEPSAFDAPGLHLKLRRLLSPSQASALLKHALAVARFRLPAGPWDGHPLGPATLESVVRVSLPILALKAALLDSMATQCRPSALVAFAEVGPWSRLVPSVGRARGIPSIDLPHADVGDPVGASGISYDAVAVYGQVGAAALRLAGVEQARIHEIGPLRYDSLIETLGSRRHDLSRRPRRVIYASQPVLRRYGLTHPEKTETFVAAVTAAKALAPSELMVVPHPTESIPQLESLIDSVRASDVEITLQRDMSLHDVLVGAWLLVTASSQSVFEAAIAGVPCITTAAAEGPGASHVSEGFSVAANEPGAVRAMSQRLLEDDFRRELTARSQRAMGLRFGRLDGRAYERAADVICSFVGRGSR